jgi:uncharacterized coiled-coil protein SlyX
MTKQLKTLSPEQELAEMLAQQKSIMAQQDAQLALICDGVGRLKNHAQTINDELVFQNKILDQMDYDVAKLNVKLNKTTKEMDKLIAPSPATNVMGWVFGPIGSAIGRLFL